MSEETESGDPSTTAPGGTKAGWGCASLVVLAVVAFVACSALAGGDNGPDEFGAKMACQDAVKEALKSPATAKFSGVAINGTGAVLTVSGNVDSQNGFGALVRSSWSCSATHTGGAWYARARVSG